MQVQLYQAPHFLDGKAGFVLAVNSFFYAFQKYIRLAELNLRDKKGA